MTPSGKKTIPRFSIVVPFRTDYYKAYAVALHRAGYLRNCVMWTRRPMPGIPKNQNELNPLLGLVSYLGEVALPPFFGEAFRFGLYPLFDCWAKSRLLPGDHIISSYAHANRCFKWGKKHGGKTFLDGGNSHPDNFWNILGEEHRRWNCPYPPVPRSYYERSRRMMDDVDYVLSPSNFVAESFLERGFSQEQIIPVVYPMDLSVFMPRGNDECRRSRPFTVINTGSLSLRKGTPYLLEAFRMIHKEIPDAKLLLTDAASDSIKPILRKYSDLPIEWAPYLPPAQLAERLRSADVFVLPSLEEGLVRTALEAMACGLPVILTPNTGTAQYVQEGVNGSVVPICDTTAIAQKVFWWREKLRSGYTIPLGDLPEKFSPEHLEMMLMAGLSKAALL